MEPTHDTTWEQAVAQLARRFEYPPTPNIASAMQLPSAVGRPLTTDHRLQTTARSGRPSAVGRRLAWALLIIALLVGGLLAVPQTRAALLSLFARVGAIDIFIDETAPPASPTTQPPAGAPAISPPATATPRSTTAPAAHSLELFELGEPSSLDEARRLADFLLVVPAALGEPDEVYVHRGIDLPAVTLVWRGEGGLLTLTEIGVEEFANKFVHDEAVTDADVNGKPAVWLAGPHRLQLLGNWQENELLIESNVLIWAADGVTYRLEGDRTEAEMVEIAESLPFSQSD
jgi:hypothetical protein